MPTKPLMPSSGPRKYKSTSDFLLAFFIAFWVLSTIFMAFSSFLFAARLLTALGTPLPTLFSFSHTWTNCIGLLLGSYYSYRYFVPRRPWPEFLSWAIRSVAASPFFAEEKLIFEDGGDGNGDGNDNGDGSGDGNGDGRFSLVPRTRRMFLWHPHGIFCWGWAVNGVLKNTFFEGETHWLYAWVLTKVPILGDITSWAPGQSVDSKNLSRLMTKGENVAFLPGGFEEATYYEKGKFRVFLKNRKGFIKFALRHGYTVHPVFSFGEERTYYAFQGARTFRKWLNRFNIPGVVIFSLLPDRNIEMTSVVGKALTFPHIEDPTHDEVSKYHEKYVFELESLFERHKAKYATADAKLEII
eukprot:466423_1